MRRGFPFQYKGLSARERRRSIDRDAKRRIRYTRRAISRAMETALNNRADE